MIARNRMRRRPNQTCVAPTRRCSSTAKTADTTWALLGFKITFKHPAGRCRRLGRHLPRRSQLGVPEFRCRHRITASASSVFVPSQLQFELHMLHTAPFFYVMCLLLAQVRPANYTYIRSCSMISTQPVLAYIFGPVAQLHHLGSVVTLFFPLSFPEVEIFSAVR